MDCFAENGKARRKVSKLVKKLRKCSRNLTLSRELLKVKKKKSRKHKFRNGGKQKEKSGKEPPYTHYYQCYKRDPKRPGGGLFGHRDPKCSQAVDKYKRALGLTVDYGSRKWGEPSSGYE